MDIDKLQPLWYEKDVSIPAHVFLVRKAAEDLAKNLDFNPSKISDIVLCVSELAQNHIDHDTNKGMMRLFGQRITPKQALFVACSLDKGPGIKPSYFYLTDENHYEHKGLGAGLNTARRLADGFALCSGRLGDSPCPDLLMGKNEYETLIAASFTQPKDLFNHMPVELSFLIRPAGANHYSGDGFFFVYEHPYILMVLMDALGKGQEAAEIIVSAKKLLSLLPAETEPTDTLMALGHHLIGSRGIMAQVVRLNVDKAEVRVAVAGNVNHFLFLDGKETLISGKKGLIGPVNSKNNFISLRYNGFRQAMGILYTDGVGYIPPIKFQQVLIDIPSIIWTNYLFPICHRRCDDAALVVWKWKS